MSIIVWHTPTFLPITLISIDALKKRTDYLMKIWQWSSQGWAVQRDLMRIHMYTRVSWNWQMCAFIEWSQIIIFMN